jgi:flagellar FliL protein
MAKQDIPDDEVAPKKNTKLIVIVIAVVLAIAGGVGGWFMMQQGGDEEEEAPPAKAKARKEAPPVYIPMDTFTVNLVPETGEQYLQVAISVEAEGNAAAEQLKLYTPRLRHEIMDILSSKRASEVFSREGKKLLADEIRAAINEVVNTATGTRADPVRAVLFTTFIIQ